MNLYLVTCHEEWDEVNEGAEIVIAHSRQHWWEIITIDIMRALWYIL